MSNKPRVGMGAIIVNPDNQILIGKRCGSHAPFYSIPGGKLDLGETFEQGIIREIKEETALEIKKPQLIAVTNNLQTFEQEELHFISLIFLVKDFLGQLKLMEPNKCEEWLWVEPTNLPQPHFEASKKGIQCYLDNCFYKV